MAKAIWRDTVIAESDKTVTIEESPYFPPESLRTEYHDTEQYALGVPVERHGELPPCRSGRRAQYRRGMVLPESQPRGGAK